MTTRRLADESVQPASFAFNTENQAWAEKRIGLYPAGRQQSAVIPLLMRAQDQDGWVTRATIETVAEMLDMPYIRVLEVATFYTQFQLQPVGKNAHIQVCGTTPCMLRGAEGLIEVCKSKIHPEPHHLNADGTMSWEEVECLGACVNAPMVMIYHDVYEDLTPERMEEIVDAFAAGKGDTIKAGPQIERQTSAAFGGRTTLLETPSATREKFVPPPAPEAPAAAAPAAAPAAPAPQPAASPTTAARPKDVAEENAPAIKGTPKQAKVSQSKAEAERAGARAEAGADGKPNTAMREGATGAESRGEAIDDGKAVGKAKASAPAADGASATVKKTKPAIKAPAADPKEVSPTAEKGGELQPLFERPEGAADDLKLISGVGPVIERKLNALGITRYDQIARFKKADIARVDDALNFKGRIERDDWLKQAKALAAGGVEEYRRVFGKDPR
ncbi:NADH dehydrogenase subunit E [Devosia lucknowensis]|uniref:NADH dehydrogenase subunit E n=1 Tax=Devosia lucknowensis TaxID=1096929 RepID=A0A1Y6EPH6_9HYPH|nr:NADH-quinone oxidoreductase subunit NuoE [Devosia lucknowensis]SMQ64246.1 NADH dehydrogenase subunit E [Devosia lucknowensis]